MNECCNDYPNFGTPNCLPDLGNVERIIFCSTDFEVELAGNSNACIITPFSNGIVFDGSIRRKLVPFPEVQNFVWTPAESQFQEASSGKKSFLREGKISITGETWDNDGTFVTVGKMQDMRCSKWAMFLVTNENNLVGQIKGNKVTGDFIFKGIPIDEQSIQALFQFKTDATTTLNMFSLDLDRNFNVRNMYSINGSTDIVDQNGENQVDVDFNDLSKTIDCNLIVNNTWITTGGSVIVRDNYTQGTQGILKTQGTITDLGVNDFFITNITDGTTITPTSITENGTGNYEFIIPAQTSGDRISITLGNSLTGVVSGEIYFAGSVEFYIP